MIGVVHCPNPDCGYPSRLSIDPPGRVFRCRRCQTKLRSGVVTREAASVVAPIGGDTGLASTFDDDPTGWLDRSANGRPAPGLRERAPFLPDRETMPGRGGEGR